MFRRLFVFICLIAPTHVFAEPHTASLRFGYATTSGDITTSLGTANIDINETSLVGGYFITDNLEITAGISTGHFRLTQNVDLDNEMFGFTYYTDRVDYNAGTGKGFYAGVSSFEQTIKMDNISGTGKQTYLTAGYEAGIGDGNSVSVQYTGNSDDFGGDNTLSLGILRCANNLCLGGSLYTSSAEEDDVTFEQEGIVVGVGLLF